MRYRSGRCGSSGRAFAASGAGRKSRVRRAVLGAASVAALAGLLPAPDASAVLFNVTWGGGFAVWNNGANWVGGVVPDNAGANTFNVTISSGMSTLDINPDVQDFNLNGTGVLNGN